MYCARFGRLLRRSCKRLRNRGLHGSDEWVLGWRLTWTGEAATNNAASCRVNPFCHSERSRGISNFNRGIVRDVLPLPQNRVCICVIRVICGEVYLGASEAKRRFEFRLHWFTATATL